MDLSNFWPLSWLQWISNAISRVGRIVAIVIAVVLWVNNIIKYCLESLFESYIQLFNSLDVNFAKGGSGSISLAAIEYIGYINAFLPVSEFVGLMTLYMTAWSIVIAMRWGKSLIPTMAN